MRLDFKASRLQLLLMLVKIVARIPENLRGLKVTRGKLLLWDSCKPSFAKSIKQLDGGEVEMEFEVPSRKLEYIRFGERFNLLVAFDEKREDLVIRRWANVNPAKVEILE